MPRRRGAGRDREPTSMAARVFETSDATVLDLVDRLLTKGVMVNGDLVIGVAGVDLIYLRLSTILCAADWILPRKRGRDIYSPATGRIPPNSGRNARQSGRRVAKNAKNRGKK